MKKELIIPKKENSAQNLLYKYEDKLCIITKKENTNTNSKINRYIFQIISDDIHLIFKVFLK